MEGFYRPTRRALVLGAAAAAVSRPAWASDYPTRPVRMVAPFAAGGPGDVIARLFAGKLSEALGQTFYVDDRPGASSNIGTMVVAHAAPDGYTLLTVSSAFTVNPSLFAKLPYDPKGDFTPVAELVGTPNVFIANKASGITSMADLITRAKARPGEINYCSGAVGTTPHLGGVMLMDATGILLTHIPFNGAAPAMEALLANTVPIACESLPIAIPSIQNGDVVALAVAATKRSALLPNTPSTTELGFPSVISDNFHGVLAPAHTPPEIVSRLSDAMVAATKQPELASQLDKLGFEVIGHGPDGMQRRIDVEIARYRELIARTGVKAG